MKKNLFQFGLLSLVLSTVAIVISSFANGDNFDKAGSLTQAGTVEGGGAVFTCTTSVGTPLIVCNVTATTTTTHPGAADSYDEYGEQTTWNTTTV